VSGSERSPLCDYVALRTGSSLSSHQVQRLVAAFEPRLQGRSEAVYLEHLKSPHGAGELAELMAAISVHKTDLFRDEVQLRAFAQFVLAPLARAARRPLKIWSAGCATGEEVATLLILLAEAGALPGSTVLGTDISNPALEAARKLCFDADLVKRVPEALRARYFSESGGRFTLAEALRSQASFARHNLMDFPYPLPEGGDGFDVIFCRNVLIYFTDRAFDATVGGLAERLAPGGTLVLSAAEPILRVHPALSTLRCEQAFFYGKKSPAPPGADDASKRTPPKRATGEWPAAPSPKREPSVAPPARRATGEVPAVPGLRRTMTGEYQAVSDPREEALSIFQLVLDWAAAGESDADTEQGLRRCLYLDPHFSQAHYLLGMLLEQRAARADAAASYRRALAALNEGRSRAAGFFLNDERLKTACKAALARLGFPG
jgi:chemotaxis protein methyltransferase CheR